MSPISRIAGQGIPNYIRNMRLTGVVAPSRGFSFYVTCHHFGCEGVSFPTIAGEGSNGAIIHYEAKQGSCHEINRSSMLLLDSGAQYEDGTTDVTRTIHFGNPSPEQKEVRCITSFIRNPLANCFRKSFQIISRGQMERFKHRACYVRLIVDPSLDQDTLVRSEPWIFRLATLN